nr:hypothetical protein [Formosa sp. Hel3_A1_48]
MILLFIDVSNGWIPQPIAFSKKIGHGCYGLISSELIIKLAKHIKQVLLELSSGGGGIYFLSDSFNLYSLGK